MYTVEALIDLSRSRELNTLQRHEAFGELVNRFQEMAYHYAYQILGDIHLAQDAAQESFVTAYKSLSQLEEPKAFPGWFRQIVFSQCHRLLRSKEEPAQSMDEVADAIHPDPHGTLEDYELKSKVLSAIQMLPEQERIVTDLFYLNGYSLNEISHVLEVPVTTVKKRLQYARQHLKGFLLTMLDVLSMPITVEPKPVPVPIPVRRNGRSR